MNTIKNNIFVAFVAFVTTFVTFGGVITTVVAQTQTTNDEEVCTQPLDVVLVIDRSGSMEQEGKYGAAKNSAKKFIDTLNTNDRAAVVHYSFDVKTSTTLGASFSASKQAIDNEPTKPNLDGPGTFTGAAIEAANNVLVQNSRDNARKVMIVLSDGKANISGDDTLSPKEFAIKEANEAKNNGIKVYAIAFGQVSDTELMKNIASTADTYLFSPSASTLEDVYMEIAQIECRSPEPTPTPSCPFNATGDQILLDFSKDQLIRSDKTLAEAMTDAYNKTVPAGDYKVQLSSFDAHSVKDQQAQKQEQWFLQFLRDDLSLVNASGLIADLPENVDQFSQTVNEKLTVNAGVTKLRAMHKLHPFATPESVVPTCALLTPIASEPETEPEPKQSCPFNATGNQILLTFEDDQIRSNKDLSGAMTAAFDKNVPAGNYKVELTSFDPHSVKPQQTQTEERWFLQFLRNDLSLVTVSNPISDLPENVNQFSETVNTNLVVGSGVTKLRAMHDAYPSDYPNSLDPVCALLTPQATQCVLPAVTITSSKSASGEVGTSFSYKISTTSTGDNTVELTVSNIPNGLTFNGVDTVSGTPTEEGDFTITAEVGNSCGTDADSIVINIKDDDDNSGCTSNCGGGGGPGRKVLRLVCEPENSTIAVNERLDLEAEAKGGNDDDYEFDWDGPGIQSTDDEEAVVRYSTPGKKIVRVTVDDGDRERTAQCKITVKSGGGSSSNPKPTPPTMTPDTPTGVVLSATPYTGFDDVLKIALFTVSTLAWAAFVGLVLSRGVQNLRGRLAGEAPVTISAEEASESQMSEHHKSIFGKVNKDIDAENHFKDQS